VIFPRFRKWLAGWIDPRLHELEAAFTFGEGMHKLAAKDLSSLRAQVSTLKAVKESMQPLRERLEAEVNLRSHAETQLELTKAALQEFADARLRLTEEVAVLTFERNAWHNCTVAERKDRMKFQSEIAALKEQNSTLSQQLLVASQSLALLHEAIEQATAAKRKRKGAKR